MEIRANLQDFRQPQLPRRVSLQLHGRAEQNQQIGLAAHMIAQLRIDQVHVDLLLSHIALLRHLGQRPCQVDNRVAPVVLGEQQDSEVLAFFLEIIRVCGLRGGVGWGVRAEVGGAEREGGLAAGAEVSLERVPDAGVGLGQVVLKRSYVVVSTYALNVYTLESCCLPVLSYTLRNGMPAEAVQAAISHTSLTKPSKPAFPWCSSSSW